MFELKKAIFKINLTYFTLYIYIFILFTALVYIKSQSKHFLIDFFPRFLFLQFSIQIRERSEKTIRFDRIDTPRAIVHIRFNPFHGGATRKKNIREDWRQLEARH